MTDVPAEENVDLPDGVSLLTLGVGMEASTNVGFTAFQIRKLPLQSSRYTAFLQVSCNDEAPEAIQGRIEIRVGGVYVSPRQFDLEPGESKGFEIPINGADGQMLQLTLDVEGDVLSLDNSIVAPLPESSPLLVAWVAEEPDPFNQLALTVLREEGELRVIPVKPEEWPVKDFDVAIFENWLPEEWPTDYPVIVVNPPGAVGPVRAVPLPSAIPHTDIRVPNEAHPVLFRVSTSRLKVTQSSILDTSGSLEPLWIAGSEALLAAGEVNGQRIVMMGFSSQRSERLPLTASFPLLFGNSIFWCAEGNGAGVDRLGDHRTGEVVDMEGERLTWTQSQSNRLVSTSQPISTQVMELERSGYWETDSGQRGISHLLSETETNVRAASEESATSLTQSSGRAGLGDLTWIILCVLLFILILESCLFHWLAVY